MSISFTTEILTQVQQTAELLGDPVEEQLLEYAPSILGQRGTSVTLNVDKNDKFWTPELEAKCREHIESFRDATGTPCRLTVVVI